MRHETRGEGRGARGEGRNLVFPPSPLAPRPSPLVLTLGELEALAGALTAVFLTFLHAAVAGQEVRIAQLLGHAANVVGAVGAFLLRGGQAEHLLEGAGDALADGAALAADTAALHFDEHVEAVA